MKFEKAELEVIKLFTNDVVVTSPDECDDPSGEGLM